MKAMMFTAVAATAVGATSALAQAPTEAPQDPTIAQQQNAPNAPSAGQPTNERKARMPMRRELPIVPDPRASASEGAGSGTSGSDHPSATELQPAQPQK